MDTKNERAPVGRGAEDLRLSHLDCGTDSITIPQRDRTRIGSRTVTFRDVGARAAPEHRIQAIWDPSPPSRWKPAQLAKYRAARDAFMARLGLGLGCKPIVLDRLDLDTARLGDLNRAAESLLKARTAGVIVALDAGEICFHGDSALVDVWSPVLLLHRDALAVLVAAMPGGAA